MTCVKVAFGNTMGLRNVVPICSAARRNIRRIEWIQMMADRDIDEFGLLSKKVANGQTFRNHFDADWNLASLPARSPPIAPAAGAA